MTMLLREFSNMGSYCQRTLLDVFQMPRRCIREPGRGCASGVRSNLSRANAQCPAWFHTREGVCYTLGMGTALYKALREAGVSDEIATAAAEDAGQTERLQRMEERLTRVEVTLRVLVGLAVAILLLQLQPFFS